MGFHGGASSVVGGDIRGQLRTSWNHTLGAGKGSLYQSQQEK